MVTIIFFLIGVLLLLCFSPGALAFSLTDPFFLRILHILTHMFAHANWSHLMGNYIFAFPYSIWLEQRIKSKQFIRFWLWSGLAAVSGQSLIGWMIGDWNGMIGSSGAIFGICAAALWLQDFNKWVKYGSRVLLSYFITTQLMYAWMAATNPFFAAMTHTAFGAHLSGILMGTFLAECYLRKERKLQAPQS